MSHDKEQANPARWQYFNERMQALGINPKAVPTFKAWHEGGTLGSRALVDAPFFECLGSGAVAINYPAIGQKVATYIEGGQEKEFRRWRNTPAYLEANPTAPKYGQPRASGVQVFLTPPVLAAVASTEQIPALYLIEGEFKAWALQQLGLHAIGLSGIHGYKLRASNDVHPIIREVILATRPERIIYLHDADAQAAPWEKWEKNPETDLGERLEAFCRAVVTFKKVYDFAGAQLFYGHPKAAFCQFGAKGFDDYIEWKRLNTYQEEAAPVATGKKSVTGKVKAPAAPPAWQTDIITQLRECRPDAQDFEFINLDSARSTDIRRHFLVNKGEGGVPNAFYMAHENRLGEDQEFVFNSGRYLFDSKAEKLILTRHEDAERFIRIGTDYYKEVFEPSPKGRPERKLRPWQKGEITQDYIKEKGLKDFLNWIPKLDTFCNVPDNTANYQLIHEVNGSRSYNLYQRLTHVPEPGTWATIEAFLRHIWGQRYEMGMDYLQLMYLRPTQPLPVIALVSKQTRTGKSTWLKLMELIFQENATIIGNEEITDRFNADYASKLFIGIDEGLIEKKATVEKIKSWVTADRINIDTKHAQRHRVGFFAKISFTSNNEDTFIPIDEEDTRFLIMKVPQLSKAERNTRLLEQLEAEIPAFLAALATRQLYHSEKGRLYFDDELLETQEKLKLRENSKDWLQGEFEHWIKDQFLDTYLSPSLYFSLEEILDKLNDRAAVKFRRQPLARLLSSVYGLESKNSTYQQPYTVQKIRLEANALSTTHEVKKGRCYTLRAEQFLNPEELEELKQAAAELHGHTTEPKTAALDPITEKLPF